MKITTNKTLQILLVVLGFGVVYWFMDSMFCFFNYSSRSLASHLFQPHTADVYRRIIVACFLAMVCSHCMEIVNAREEELDELSVYINNFKNVINESQDDTAPGEIQEWIAEAMPELLDGQERQEAAELKSQKIFFAVKKNVAFTCGACSISQSVDITKGGSYERAIAVKCRCDCGQCFEVLPDKRVADRQEVCFQGVYLYTDYFGDRLKGAMTVKNISRFGLQMKMEEEHDFLPGDNFDVVMKLEVEESVTVKKSVVVRNTCNSSLGSEFIEAEPDESPLGTFLQKKGVA